MSESAGSPAGSLAARLSALGPRQRRLLRARLAGAAAPDGQAAPVPLPRDGRPLPASFFQERLWLVDQLLPGSSAYVVCLGLRVRGTVRAELMTRALGLVIERHESLRTGLDQVDDRLVQVVRPAVPVPLQVRDVRGSDDPLAEADGLLRAAATEGFDLARAPLLRACLIRTGDRECRLGLFVHHAVTDGWSNGILLRELATAYCALLAGEEPRLPPVRLQYADVAAWQRSRLTERRQEELFGYWADQLRGAPEVSALPLDRPRRSDVAPRGGSQRFTLPAATAERLRELARQEKVTTFMVALAGLAAVLARWTGQSDVVVGSPYSCRTHPDLAGVVGPLVNTVALRLDAAGEITARELLRRSRRVTLGAQAHADLPFERLVERLRPTRSAAHHPVFQVNLGVSNASPPEPVLPGATFAPMSIADDRAPKFDLSLYLTVGTEWYGTIEYHADLFAEATVAHLAGALCALWSGLADDPDRQVAALPVGELPAAGADGPPAPEVAAASIPVPRPPIVAPRDRWEGYVALAWSQVLGIDPVGVRDDFFALGGHSMAGMLAIERIHQLTGRRIGLATLFQHPTVAALAGVLRGADARVAGPPFVVELQPTGSLPPLFLTPPAIGELAVYFPLIRALATDRPVHGLQPDGFFRQGDPGDRTLSAQAARYAREIVSARPEGPYHLCGFSAAGRLAVAVADQLAARGGRVGAVVLLDSAPFGDVPADPDLATVLARWLPFAPSAGELSGLDRDGQIASVMAAGQRSGDLPASVSLAEFRQWCRKLEFGARALASHGPLRYDGTIDLLVRSLRPDRDIVEEWRQVAVDLRVVPVEVDSHMSFVAGERVPAVARVLAERLAAADPTDRGQP